MPIDTARAKKHLHEFNFPALFVEELGWDKHKAQLSIPVDGQTFELSAVAEKRGLAAFVCACGNGTKIPDYNVRRKIERQVAKSAHEHFIIFTDEAKTTQIWQWVKREAGKPAACREHHFDRGQSGEALIQKLKNVGFELDEEENLTLIDVTIRARAGFDVEKVTKRFYERFQKEHDAFLKFIKGIPDDGLHRWYASVMLNRLMFIYFIQTKGFLNSDTNYLRNKLAVSKPKDRYFSDFLCPLFFEGFAKKDTERTAAVNQLLGQVPYLNGGLFLRHQIEELHGKTIQISDAAFQRIFDFFEAYQWHLDERPLRADNEINPDVLGYIFEKYINQKQMGAYYTKEDITEYISKNTVLPFLFDAARPKCKIAFENANGPTIWDLLSVDPDRYIYSAVRHGTDKRLPSEITAGITDVSKRTSWNKAAPSEFAIPTEIWREVIARRQRYEDIKKKLRAGEVREINELITLNLDIRQFTQDVIENREGPELLRAFWHAVENMTVLDPACGSGAFLFAALNILEPLYEACLDRMKAFVSDLERSEQKHRPEKFSDFRQSLERVANHPNHRYFIFKSIILNNLFGADIMEEATEICKLRLFLKLVAQIDHLDQIEPLPDIDFNIRSGNSLVGYATADEVRRSMQEFGDGQMRLGVEDELKSYARFAEKVEVADLAFQQFRRMQTERGMTPKDFVKAKATLRDRLTILEDELNRYLAGDYGVKTSDNAALSNWLKSHQPFHWFVEFYGIVSNGGFDVIIGNPPYLEIREVPYRLKNYTCLDSGAIHAMFVERSARLLHKKGCMSMIVPMSLPSTQRMQIVQQILEADRNAWYANYAWRPAKLFDTVNRALTVFVVTPSRDGHTFSTNYQKWTSDDRDGLFGRLVFVSVPRNRPSTWIPKLGAKLEREILEKCLSLKTAIKRFSGPSEHRIYYRTTGGLYWKVFTDFAPAFRLNGKVSRSSRETWFTVAKREYVKSLIAALSSDIFWWWYTVTSNLRDLNPYDIQNFPVPESALVDSKLRILGERYLADIKRNSTMLVRQQKQTGRTETQSFKIQKSKPILAEIDALLAKHYGFTEEELDFIINYDIKYRMGLGGEDMEG